MSQRRVGSLLTTSAVRLHRYGKREPRPARKMGHLTVIGEDAKRALDKALAALVRRT